MAHLFSSSKQYSGLKLEYLNISWSTKMTQSKYIQNISLWCIQTGFAGKISLSWVFSYITKELFR